MREPRPGFAPVHAESLQPLLDVPGKSRGASGLVAEDEHADALRLAVAVDLEPHAGGA